MWGLFNYMRDKCRTSIGKEVTMKHTVWTAALAMAFVLTGCGASSGTSSATEDRDVLTAAEIATTAATNAYDAISMKRPWFLQSRGPRSLGQPEPPEPGQTTEFPVVYVNRMYYGDLESLRLIPVQQISIIRFLDSNAATMEFGAGHTGGIILITTKPA